ncbi:MAG TPA: hypothetical protein VLW54_14160 [Candidatus Acidoferrales bacterium]|nr:hypothetical protein [Candidatus Acidoferrales bacterium]
MKFVRPALAAAALPALLLGLCPQARATDLKPETLAAFNRFAAARDAQFDAEVQHDAFLWVDVQPPPKRDEYYRQLRAQGMVIERLGQTIDGRKFEVPDAMVHHWVALVFIPGVHIGTVVRMVEDYDHHSRYYAPEVARSKLISRDDGHFLVYLRFHAKHILSVTVDTWMEAWYRTLSPTREVSRSHTTHAQEVENEGQPDETLLPEGHDRGFLWRMNTYWKFEEKDGGTYVQCESITLTRSIPAALKWLIEPFITSVPRESLVALLNHTRKFAREAAAADSAPPPAKP